MLRWPTSILMTLILANAAVGASAYTVDGVGAKGFSTIQEAIDASEAGDEIIILNGTYSENLVIDKSLALKGEGGAVVNGSGSSSPLVTITSDNVTLEGLTFAGCKNESFDSGAVLVLADGCRLLNSTISASTGNGLCLRDSRDHLAAGNLICDNRYGGVSALGANNSELSGNQIFNNGRWGISLEGCAFDMLFQNDIRENGEVGLQLVGSIYNTVAYNGIQLNAEDGMHLIDSSHTAIVENQILDNGLNGVALDRSKINVLSKNVIQGSGEDGLLVIRFSDDNIFTGNALSENGINGIGIYGSYFISISENRIFDNEYNGISLRDNSSSTLISDNQIRGNKRFGFYLEDSNKNFFEGNDVYGNLHGVIMTRSSDNVMVGNEIHDNRFGLSMEFSDSASVSNNYIYNNSDDGVQLKSCDRSKVWENYVNENGGDGVHLSGSESLVASRNIIENNSKYGIQMLDRATNNIFMYNVIQHNGGGGMYIYEGTINLITGNIFADNQNFNARDNGQINNWLANFYGDYSGEAIGGGVVGIEPYAIQGRRGATTIDLNPVVVRSWLEERGAD